MVRTTSDKYGQMFKTLPDKQLIVELHKLLTQLEMVVYNLEDKVNILEQEKIAIKNRSFLEGYDSGYIAGQK